MSRSTGISIDADCNELRQSVRRKGWVIRQEKRKSKIVAFCDYQKHCTECKQGNPCGKYHLYLMILEPTIKKIKRFKAANPDYVDGAPLYYVGKTKHHPRCRQSMHQTYKKTGTPKWRCYCQVSPGRNDFEGFWHNPSFYVQKHTNGYLKSAELRPYLDTEAATKAERDLAKKLRKQGFGVWAGHHDQKKIKQAKV